MTFVHTNVTMQIIGRHPHAGELCHPIGDDSEHVTLTFDLYHVKLLNCPHGVEECGVSQENLKLIVKPDK